ncbi:Plasmodium vivax Vir protein, putative [Plasmodium vivax]|nr:Plasmodium vivax Vir protein, putative [Plasmodium vivax]
MNDYLGDDDVDILNTKHYYGKLDKGLELCQYYEFYDKAKTELDKNAGLEKDSDKIISALCYVYTMSSNAHFDTNICNFLYYWLGNILLEKLITKDLFHEVILDLFNTLINKNRKICELPHSLMFKEDFKDFKLIFDCSEDYKSYKVQYINPTKSCNNNYNSHLESNIEIYNRFYSECEVHDLKKPYCDTFRKYFSDKNGNLLSQFKCKLETKDPRVRQLEKGHMEAQAQAGGRQIIGGLQGEEEFSVVPEIEDSPAEFPSSTDFYVNREDSQMGSNSLPSDGTPSSITSKSITGAVSVAGALVPSYLLYNYTPAGNLINKLLGRTTRMNHNPLTEAQLMNNFYQPEGFNSERSGYNISYRPV